MNAGKSPSERATPARLEAADLAQGKESKRVLGLLFTAVFSALMSQFIFLPVLPPLAREVGLSEFQTGLLDSIVLLTLALVLIGLGFGLAVPGYTAAPTLLVGDDEQGGVAGLISATNGLAFVLGPLLGSALYGLRPEYPYVFSVVVLALSLGFVLVYPGMRRAAKKSRARSLHEEVDK